MGAWPRRRQRELPRPARIHQRVSGLTRQPISKQRQLQLATVPSCSKAQRGCTRCPQPSRRFQRRSTKRRLRWYTGTEKTITPLANIFHTAISCGTAILRIRGGRVGRGQVGDNKCKIYPARTHVALLWVVAHRHHHHRLVGVSLSRGPVTARDSNHELLAS